MKFCSSEGPLAFDGRLSPCLWLPLHGGFTIFLSLFVLAYAYRQGRFKHHQNTAQDAAEGIAVQVPSACKKYLKVASSTSKAVAVTLFVVMAIQFGFVFAGDDDSIYAAVASLLLSLVWLFISLSIQYASSEHALELRRTMFLMTASTMVTILFDVVTISFLLDAQVSPSSFGKSNT